MYTNDVIPFHALKNKLVHIVDHDTKTCQALLLLLRMEGFEATFSLTAEDFLIRAERRTPDVVIVNSLIGNFSGLALLPQIRRFNPSCVIVMIADRPDIDETIQAIKSGATYVFGKPVDHERLTWTIRNAFRQAVCMVEDENGVSRVSITGFPLLTSKERQVLELIVNGDSSKVAGKKLNISHRTIEVHRAHIMSKLKARNVADLMRVVLSGNSQAPV
ncbi:Two-component response regulator, FixJ family, consists of REC and HTH domains [Devosia crocina]|uniref:Two-component response regulator, FixJ family, consists of REC and HTH domains n=1 Tax=Devosia crocina TaxID=429728 RepID=A0A1I7NC54_9HYPH|nr:LuxR C-terminal-related transcriptional regulator [Devosia crocina]SFV32221.1 Two-component response regulator, FixJ family, consists of REC and HTH domains [Devosia crocina]